MIKAIWQVKESKANLGFSPPRTPSSQSVSDGQLLVLLVGFLEE